MAEIDTATVARGTGVEIGTLNVWVQRRLIPGADVGMQGRARAFTLDQALHIAIMAALVRHDWPAPVAAAAATKARLSEGSAEPGAKLIVGPPRGNRLNGIPTIDVVVASLAELDAWLDGFVEGRPESFTIIELDRLVARVRRFVEHPDPAERVRRERGALTGSEMVRQRRQERLARERTE